MTEEYKNIISSAIYRTVQELLGSQEEFSIIVQNHNNWNIDLPERLKTQSQFIMNIKEQTLEDSYVEDGKIIINTEFDGQDYSKEFGYADIAGIIEINGKTPVMVKPFTELPEIPEPTKALNNKVDEKGLQFSMESWKRNNPELF